MNLNQRTDERRNTERVPEKQQQVQRQERTRVQTAMELREAIWTKANEWFLADPKVDFQQTNLNIHEEMSKLESLEKTYGYRSTTRKQGIIPHDKVSPVKAMAKATTSNDTSPQVYSSFNGRENGSGGKGMAVVGSSSPSRHNRHVQEQYTKGKMMIREEMKQQRQKREEREQMERQMSGFKVSEDTDDESDAGINNVHNYVPQAWSEGNHRINSESATKSDVVDTTTADNSNKQMHHENGVACDAEDSERPDYSSDKNNKSTSGDDTESDVDSEDDLVDDFDDE